MVSSFIKRFLVLVAGSTTAYSVLLVFLFGFTLSLSAQFSPDKKMDNTSSGREQISISNLEWALTSIQYLEKKNNNWYERFWEKEGLTSPEDMYVQVLPAYEHEEGAVVVFDISEDLEKEDSTFVIHNRIANMLFTKLQGYAEKKWLVWMSGVRLNYRYDPDQDENRAYSLIIPYEGNLKLLPPEQQIGDQKKQVKAQEFARERIRLIHEDLELVYQEFLNLSGFEIPYDARIVVRADRQQDNVINVVMEMSKEVVESDPQLDAHRNLADKFLPFIERKARPFKPDWLIFRVLADTSEGSGQDAILK